MRMSRLRRNGRAFAAAFTATFCLLALGLGFLVAEINTRRMAFGPEAARMEYVIEDGRLTLRSLSGETQLTIPPAMEQWAGRIWNAIPARLRVSAMLPAAEQALAPAALEWIQQQRDASSSAETEP